MTRRSVVERPAAGVADPVSKPLVIVAFAIVYIVWGSTYLAIRYAVETLPPLLMAGTRFLVAGGLLYAWLLLRGEAGAVGRREWRAAFVIGGLLLLGGNGFVVWAEQWVPSGVASLLVGTVPVWMVLFEWRRHGGDRPTSRVALGLALGFIGIAVLAGPGDWAGGAIHAPGAVALVLASILWAAGAIYSRSAPLPKVPLQSTAMQMIAGGLLLVVASALLGELGAVNVGSFTWKAVAAWAYLIVFGSLAGFTAYTWLLRVSTPARVATTAYVNPVVAVILGWTIASEPLTMRVGVAVVAIVIAVIAMTRK